MSSVQSTDYSTSHIQEDWYILYNNIQYNRFNPVVFFNSQISDLISHSVNQSE